MPPIQPPPDPIAARLLRCYTGAVYDVLRGLGFPNQALPSSIHSLFSAKKAAGPAFTVAGHAYPNLSAHESLLHWTAFLSKAPAGTIVVCQPNDSTFAHMGELSAETLNYRGVKGYVVDGGCRDTEFIAELGFPVFCRYLTPVDVVGRWKAETFGLPISIGGVTVASGDYVLGDHDGVVIIPKGVLDEVVEKSEVVMTTENKVRTAIMEGMDPQEAYLQYGKF